MAKRLFFGLEVKAPWPEELPRGRILEESRRHVTLAFLGNVDEKPLLEALPLIPLPAFAVGPTGFFSDRLFLPPRRPNVIAWKADWFQEGVESYQQKLSQWVTSLGYALDERPFLSHVTLARWPFDKTAWAEQDFAFPVYGLALHLYESKGNMQYEPLWTHDLKAPIEILSHTADIAFTLRGGTIADLFYSALTAMALEFPPILKVKRDQVPTTHDEIVAQLNRLVARIDAEVGAPFKAVSYHGELAQKQGYLEWEMIVDV